MRLPAQRHWLLMLCAVGLPVLRSAIAVADEPRPPAFSAADLEFFETKVRPLLVARCHECHSGDKPKGGLRLDARAAVLAGGDTGPAAIAGKPDESLLVDAVRYGDTYQMPPKSQLPAEEVAVLADWVARGVPWPDEAAPPAAAKPSSDFNLAERAKHWSFQRLTDPEPPAVRDASWPRGAIDRFILARLEAAGLAPAPQADRAALLRRVTFDLVGLPPTPEELVAFLADTSPDAYERAVDRLLAAPQYGERWARHWLDLMRYAETHGHEFDFDIPNAWRYRDYVIRACNDDLPFDQFVVEHIAGDLLEQPRANAADRTNESILATAWWFLGEAVHSPVDVRQDEADRMANQIDVLGKAFVGLTIACARCHDHKFDPISSRDYYALAGYLQSSRYQQAYIDLADAAVPLVEFDSLSRANKIVEQLLAAGVPPAPAGADVVAPEPSQSATRDGDVLVAEFADGDYGGWSVTGPAFGTRALRPADVSPGEETDPRKLRKVGSSLAHSGALAGKLRGALRSPTFEITRSKLLYRVAGTSGKVRLVLDGLQLIRAPIYGGLEFAPGGPELQWHVQDVSKWIGHRAYIELVDDGDGWLALDRVVLSDHDAPGDPGGAHYLATDLAACRAAERDNALLAQFTSAPGDAVATQGSAPIELIERLTAELTALVDARRQLEAAIGAPRLAPAILDGTAENERLMIRGSPRTLGPEVPRRWLEALGGRDTPPEQIGSGRLELARQIVDTSRNPLLPRVLVNRLWHHHFGAGLVRTPDDFGVMGQAPTHPELLDYLARRFVDSGWSIKAMQREIVLSSTYRMASDPRPEADTADPENRLWHRRAIRRLEAECVRDAMLAISGRLDPTLYGPSVAPHLTEFMIGRGRPSESGPLDGAGRRSIYLNVRRNFLSPLLMAFDYPTPFTTIGRRSVSNVPAQALAMINNPLVAGEAARWAELVLALPDVSDEERVERMFAAAFCRPPNATELATARQFLESQRSGARESSEGKPAQPELAAWTGLAHALWNVKEFVFVP
ncbi:MAG: PSD1 and planctomycete cytochrome C domain-containing protein [Pirellulales bacterium]|nr:PSD1 and planctomycete cytochrome C domain-containing protein [Pirellulales bacterium]